MAVKQRLKSLFPTMPDFGAIQADLDGRFGELLVELKAIHAVLDEMNAKLGPTNQGGTP
jgi:hypothetical protein